MQKTNGFQSLPCVFLEFKSIHKLCFYILSIMLHTLKNQVTPGCEQTLKQEGATDAASTTISLVTQKGIDDTSTTGCRTHPSVTPLTHSDDGGENETRAHARMFYSHIGPRTKSCTMKRLTRMNKGTNKSGILTIMVSPERR